jgi:EAL and modified HD-GYP domain-containing signal transduction protein
MFFGLKRVQAWSTMISMECAGEVVPEIFVMALTRATFMREVAIRECLPFENTFYLAGLFSLLDVIMNQPLEQALSQLPLQQRIVDGLLEERGDYGRLLNIAKSFEQSEAQQSRVNYGDVYLRAFKETLKILN